MQREGILIFDYGSQYTQLIARRLRELEVYCEVIPGHHQDKIEGFSVKGIILSGGPQSIHHEHALLAPGWVWMMDVPILGVCYGMQMMAAVHEGKVIADQGSEFGHVSIDVEEGSWLHEAVEVHTLPVWMSHYDHVHALPDTFQVNARSPKGHMVAMSHSEKPWYGVQFHPEVTHTPRGKDIFDWFSKRCDCRADWSVNVILEETTTHVQNHVSDDQDVLVALSGGVDSAVVALLCHRALGAHRVHCVMVDHGLLRLQEVEDVKALFVDHFGMDLHVIDAQALFLKALKDVDDPEEKRKIIGHLFIEVFSDYAKDLKEIDWLAQGTIYPDRIESAGVGYEASNIKSHHNVGGLPEHLPFKLLEPLDCLFKDEVRKLGLALGLPERWVRRHPFPGPGMAVRIMGPVTEHALDILKRVDAIWIKALHEAQWYDKVSQAFAVFLPVKSVGVAGDQRKVGWTIVLRAVKTEDFMTASSMHFPQDFLASVTRQILNEVPEVVRVTYDLTEKPPGTIEWE